MDGKQYSLPLILVAIFCSCANNSNNDAAFKMLNESLVRSNAIIDGSTFKAYKSLEEKLTDPTTAVKAQIWYPKAIRVRELSKEIIDHIEKLKNQVSKQESLSHERLIDLYDQLEKYKNYLLGTDSSLRMEFENAIIVTDHLFDSAKAGPNEFPKIFFNHISEEATLATLTKFQNNIKINENKMIRFCDLKVTGIVIDYYDTYSAMVNQSSSYVKGGDQIELTAGVGAFSRKAKPIITIDGKNIDLEVDGVAYHKFRAPKHPGKHFIPVEVRFTDQEGKKQTITKTIEYTVLE